MIRTALIALVAINIAIMATLAVIEWTTPKQSASASASAVEVTHCAWLAAEARHIGAVPPGASGAMPCAQLAVAVADKYTEGAN